MFFNPLKQTLVYKFTDLPKNHRKHVQRHGNNALKNFDQARMSNLLLHTKYFRNKLSPRKTDLHNLSVNGVWILGLSFTHLYV